MNKPLVSVVVISYNSSKTIEETLDSIKAQTYDNIELIVSDDHSVDNTCDVVDKWLQNNSDGFVKALLVSSEKNSGPAGNANRGIRNGKGAWIKLIAADDALLPNCIEDNVEFIKNNPEAQIVFSRVFPLGDGKLPIDDDYYLHFWSLSKKRQYFMLLMNNCLYAASAFIKRDTWKSMGQFDETIPFIEDWPFWIKVMRCGTSLNFLNRQTVLYRVHDSLSLTATPSANYLKSLAYVKQSTYQYQLEISPLFRFYCYVNERYSNKILRIILLLFNPYYWYMKHVLSPSKF
jgi:alpha-1,3-rhamnosyltransferase